MGEIDIERVVRDAIIGYENTFCKVCGNTNDGAWLDDLADRRIFANDWLVKHGYAPEPVCEPMKPLVEKRLRERTGV